VIGRSRFNPLGRHWVNLPDWSALPIPFNARQRGVLKGRPRYRSRAIGEKTHALRHRAAPQRLRRLRATALARSIPTVCAPPRAPLASPLHSDTGLRAQSGPGGKRCHNGEKSLRFDRMRPRRSGIA